MNKYKNSKIVTAFNDYMPDSLIGRVTRFGLLLFVCAIPVYTYQNFISDTPQILKTPCKQVTDLSPANQQRIDELIKYAGGKDTVPVCTLLPVPTTQADLSEMTGMKQLTHYPVPLLGSIYYYLASNILIFVSLSFLFVVIVLDKYPLLGRSFPRQFLTASAVFLIATNVFIPTVESRKEEIENRIKDYQKKMLQEEQQRKSFDDMRGRKPKSCDNEYREVVG